MDSNISKDGLEQVKILADASLEYFAELGASLESDDILSPSAMETNDANDKLVVIKKRYMDAFNAIKELIEKAKASKLEDNQMDTADEPSAADVETLNALKLEAKKKNATIKILIDRIRQLQLELSVCNVNESE